jgi:phenylacetate-CoA ligase
LSTGIRRPWQAVDPSEVARLYPPAPEYFESAWYADPEQIERVQLARLRERAAAAERVPFFRDRWSAVGFSARDIRSPDDRWRAPSYTVDDIRKSIEAHPPWGDYQAVTPPLALREPMRVHMSGGTTGKSRPTFYTAWDREVGAVLTARALYMQGIRPGDVVLNSWSYGLHNGAWNFDEALYRWLNCVVVTAGTGLATSSERQIEIAAEYGATAILTTGDYLLRLVDAAREAGYEPERDLKIRALPNIGSEDTLERMFGVPTYRSYGFHEVQWVSVECPEHDGLHIFEDAFVVQVVDPDTGEPLPDGELGSLCVTELYKTGSPQFRYNIMDLSALRPRERCACGSWLRKMEPFAGRGDNMVKLRGINVWPEAVGEIATAVEGVEPDYFVRAVRDGDRDELVVSVVGARARVRDEAARAELGAAVERRLRDRLGVKIRVEVVAPGALDEWTEVDTSPKPKRFRDDRP